MNNRPSHLFAKRAALLWLSALCAGCSITPLTYHQPTTIEAAVFEGGYGIEWHKQVARSYERLHPGLRVNLWGDPRVDEKLKPRVLRDDPPDLANSSLPVWKLIVAGKLYPLDAALDSPAVGQPGTWRQSLEPGILADYQYHGKTYAVPSNLSAWVCWYDKRLFRKHGWQPPVTWTDFTRLCDSIKSAGIAPLAFQGKYPTYAWATLLTLYERLVPFKYWNRMEMIAPNGFNNPDFIRAASLMQQMALKYFEPGSLAMTHTEAQLEWVNGRAALCFCGLWLHNEMKSAIPKGFEMSCFPVPEIEGGQGDPHALYGSGAEDFMVFAKAKHPAIAADFLKYMLSLDNAHRYIRQLDTLSPVRNSTRGVTLAPDLQSAVGIVNHRSILFSDNLTSLYPSFADSTVRDGLADLLSGKDSPEVFARKLQSGIDAIRRDPDIFKPPSLLAAE
ncbi:MAG TPA: extracellular solute-binding protein [Chthonomonadales bacterium]|nr:extracellular solute-binding protein [Chthonomonadales bacterium]